MKVGATYGGLDHVEARIAAIALVLDAAHAHETHRREELIRQIREFVGEFRGGHAACSPTHLRRPLTKFPANEGSSWPIRCSILQAEIDVRIISFDPFLDNETIRYGAHFLPKLKSLLRGGDLVGLGEPPAVFRVLRCRFDDTGITQMLQTSGFSAFD